MASGRRVYTLAYDAALTGGLIGGSIALGFWSVTFTGLDRRFPGFLGSGGAVSLIALCLWFDGWIAVALMAFCAGLSGLLMLGGGGRGPRRAPHMAARAVPWRADAWGFAPLPPRTAFSARSAHRPLTTVRSRPN
jgi:hypothetical protein